MRKKNILLVAGDPSGDLHGATLIKELKSLDPSIQVASIGGSHIREVADNFLLDLASFGLAGFLDPVRRFFFFKRVLNTVREYIEKEKPRAVIPVDFYGFNHQVLGLARHRGVPAFYYISPQVWASRPGRTLRLRRLVKRMILIFPFEVALYEKAGVPCTFVGHPLLDLLPEPHSRNGDQDRHFKVGLLPGSRPAEVERHIPIFLQALARIKQSLPDIEAMLFAPPSVTDEYLHRLIGRVLGSANSPVSSTAKQPSQGAVPHSGAGRISPCTWGAGGAVPAAKPGNPTRPGDIRIVRESDYKQRAELDFALTSSGTATLENALLGIPMVVVYQVNWLTYWIARSIIRIPHIAMANILAERLLVPEFIQSRATPENVARAAQSLLTDGTALKKLRVDLIALRSKLGKPGAARRAAEIILREV